MAVSSPPKHGRVRPILARGHRPPPIAVHQRNSLFFWPPVMFAAVGSFCFASALVVLFALLPRHERSGPVIDSDSALAAVEPARTEPATTAPSTPPTPVVAETPESPLKDSPAETPRPESPPSKADPSPFPVDDAKLPAPSPKVPEPDSTPVTKLLDPSRPKTPGCQQYGTQVDFFDNPAEAIKRAKKEEKLLFVLHVAGNFEEPGFT
jgi:hypothetical protein